MGTEEIIELAERLGKSIGDDALCKALRAAEKKLEGSPESNENMKALNEHALVVQALEADGKPVEVEDKHKMRDLQNKVRSDPILQEIAKAEADMVELMNKVNRAIQEGMSGGGE